MYTLTITCCYGGTDSLKLSKDLCPNCYEKIRSLLGGMRFPVEK